MLRLSKKNYVQKQQKTAPQVLFFCHRWPNVFPCLKLSVLWTISKGVSIIRADRTNFDVVNRQIEKVHRRWMFHRLTAGANHATSIPRSTWALTQGSRNLEI